MKIMRKNKTKLKVELSTATLFMINDIAKLNPTMKKITLRSKIMTQIKDGKIAEIGSLPGGKGRPVKVFSFTPVTSTILEKAKSKGINLVDDANDIFNIVSANPIIPPTIVNTNISSIPAILIE